MHERVFLSIFIKIGDSDEFRPQHVQPP